MQVRRDEGRYEAVSLSTPKICQLRTRFSSRLAPSPSRKAIVSIFHTSNCVSSRLAAQSCIFFQHVFWKHNNLSSLLFLENNKLRLILNHKKFLKPNFDLILHMKVFKILQVNLKKKVQF